MTLGRDPCVVAARLRCRLRFMSSVLGFAAVKFIARSSVPAQVVLGRLAPIAVTPSHGKVLLLAW